jgi:hypothetical protein
MSAPAFGAHRYHGPSPAQRVLGGEDGDPRSVADTLSHWWRERFREFPAGDFPRPDWLKARMLDSAVRRGWIETCGYHRGGKWFYRLTHFGAAVAEAVRC